jgi:hypothetical protein
MLEHWRPLEENVGCFLVECSPCDPFLFDELTFNPDTCHLIG